MANKIKVFIDGQAGTTGLKLLERLTLRDDLQLLQIADDLRKDATAKAQLMNESDVVFLCLPDAAAIESAALVTNPNTVVIDASTAHRTADGWAYGFPELSAEHRKKIQKSKRIAVPGCHAGGFIALVYPLIAAGVIAPDYPLCATGLTGYSGGGKTMIAEYEAGSDELKSPMHYALTQNHKHLKEMTAIAGLAYPPVFSPVVDDYFAGMTISVPLIARLMAKRLTVAELAALYNKHYAGQTFVRVKELPAKVSAIVNTGSNYMDVYVGGNDDRMVVYASFDNLGKGASGAAVQCMNIALGLDETQGLIKE